MGCSNDRQADFLNNFIYKTCHLELRALSFRGRENETIRSTDYLEQLQLIDSQCLGDKDTYTGDVVEIGEERNFYAFLGTVLQPGS